MGEEELELYRDLFEIEPFFHSHEEKSHWKLHKVELKKLREQRRKILKHEREIREIETAYRQLNEPGYAGDLDIDHKVEENRKLCNDGHVVEHVETPVVHHDTSYYTVDHPVEHHSTVVHEPVYDTVTVHEPA